MTIYFGTDHAGFELKEKLVLYVRNELGYDVVDCGATELDPNDDYPAFIRKAVAPVSEKPTEAKAIVLGGSGQGEAIVANRFPHVRTTVYYGGNTEILVLGRAHNDANVLSLGARCLTTKEAEEAVALWLSTACSHDERHVRRVAQIDAV